MGLGGPTPIASSTCPLAQVGCAVTKESRASSLVASGPRLPPSSWSDPVRPLSPVLGARIPMSSVGSLRVTMETRATLGDDGAVSHQVTKGFSIRLVQVFLLGTGGLDEVRMVRNSAIA